MNTDVTFIRPLRMGPVLHTKSASTGTSCTSCSVQGNGKSNTTVKCRNAQPCTMWAGSRCSIQSCLSLICFSPHAPWTWFTLFDYQFQDIWNIWFSNSPVKLWYSSDHKDMLDHQTH